MKLAENDSDFDLIAFELCTPDDDFTPEDIVAALKDIVARSRLILKRGTRSAASLSDIARRSEGVSLKRRKLAELPKSGQLVSNLPQLPPLSCSWLNHRQRVRALAPDGISRVVAEARAKEKWSHELDVVLDSSGYPTVGEASRMADPKQALVAQSGGDRPNTIRNRLAPYAKFAAWLK